MATRGDLIDTPGIEGDATFLNGLIMEDYRKSVSLLKRGGFQRPAMKMEAGRKSFPPYFNISLTSRFELFLLACSSVLPFPSVEFIFFF